MARPSIYSEELANLICEELSKGNPLYRLCQERDDFPAESTVYAWLGEKAEFSEKYARARERQADRRADEIIEIADTVADAAIARNRIDARKWAASKLAPKKYGDKIALGGAEDLGPVKTIITWQADE